MFKFLRLWKLRKCKIFLALQSGEYSERTFQNSTKWNTCISWSGYDHREIARSKFWLSYFRNRNFNVFLTRHVLSWSSFKDFFTLKLLVRISNKREVSIIFRFLQPTHSFWMKWKSQLFSGRTISVQHLPEHAVLNINACATESRAQLQSWRGRACCTY